MTNPLEVMRATREADDALRSEISQAVESLMDKHAKLAAAWMAMRTESLDVRVRMLPVVERTMVTSILHALFLGI